MENKEIFQTELRLIKVIETGFSTNFENLNSDSSLDLNAMQVELGFRIDPQLEKNILILLLRVEYIYPIEGIKTKILELTTSNYFEIKDLGNVIAVENNQLTDKVGIMSSLLGICIGTLRGILVTKTAGTVIADHPLPIFNPNEIVGLSQPQKHK